MKLDDKTLEQFKKIYFEEFGENLSDKEAYERFSRLVNVVRIIYFPSSSPLDKPDGYVKVHAEK